MHLEIPAFACDFIGRVGNAVHVVGDTNIPRDGNGPEISFVVEFSGSRIDRYLVAIDKNLVGRDHISDRSIRSVIRYPAACLHIEDVYRIHVAD